MKGDLEARVVEGLARCKSFQIDPGNCINHTLGVWRVYRQEDRNFMVFFLGS